MANKKSQNSPKKKGQKSSGKKGGSMESFDLDLKAKPKKKN